MLLRVAGTAQIQINKFRHGDLSFHIGIANNSVTRGLQADFQRAALLERLEVLKQVIINPVDDAETLNLADIHIE